MEGLKHLTLWSLRSTVACGDIFVSERTVTEQTSQEWLAVFRNDEPAVLFVACAKKPKTK